MFFWAISESLSRKTGVRVLGDHSSAISGRLGHCNVILVSKQTAVAPLLLSAETTEGAWPGSGPAGLFPLSIGISITWPGHRPPVFCAAPRGPRLSQREAGGLPGACWVWGFRLGSQSLWLEAVMAS